MSATSHTPPPGTAIITTGKVQKGDWFFIEQFGAWALCPAIAYGESVVLSGHLVARCQCEKNNPVKRDEAAWKN